MKVTQQLTTLILVGLLALSSNAQRLKGSGTLNFGWKLERCVKALGNPEQSTLESPTALSKKYSYRPASWEGIKFDNSILDFYDNALYQIGFSKTTTIADRSTFNALVKKVTSAYGTPLRLKSDDPYRLLWRLKRGDMIMVEYSYINEQFMTFLILINNEISMKKARDNEN